MIIAASICLLAGCASRPSSAQLPGGDAKKILQEGEYEYVTVTGSLIPVKVPKSPTARPLPPAQPVSEMSPETFRDIVQRGLGRQ